MVAKKDKKIHIGRIHAEWCGHCKSLKEPWKIMKEMISLNMDNDLKHHHVHYHDFEDKNDQSEDYNKKIDDFNNLYLSESPNKVSIQGGFPTLFRVLNGKLTYYNGKILTNDNYESRFNISLIKKDLTLPYNFNNVLIVGRIVSEMAGNMEFSEFKRICGLIANT